MQGRRNIMWQPVLMINGFIVFILGALMLVPAAALKYYTGFFDAYFIQSGFFAMFVGGSLFLANYGRIKNISRRRCSAPCPFSATAILTLFPTRCLRRHPD